MSHLEEFRKLNARLRNENETLKKRLELERPHSVADRMNESHCGFDVDSCKKLIRERQSQAAILNLHDELLQLSRQCSTYANALEKVRGNFSEMKWFYSELNQILGSGISSNSQ